jgi:RND family efflux transporter MFP subunit
MNSRARLIRIGARAAPARSSQDAPPPPALRTDFLRLDVPRAGAARAPILVECPLSKVGYTQEILIDERMISKLSWIQLWRAGAGACQRTVRWAPRAVLVLLLLASGCRKHTEAPVQPPSVTVKSPVSQPVTEYLDLTGTLAPSKSVDLVARVNGYLESIDFKDGDFVEQGQQLFVIEPEPYRQQVALNEAALLQAQSEYDRQNALMKENATSSSNVEKWQSTRDQAKAQVELAKINLGYTKVTAPFSGRIGRRQVDPGNLVGPGNTVKIATLEQLRPIYANFNLNERDALHLYEKLRKVGMEPKAAVGKAPVLIGLSNEQGYPHQGVLDFTDNEISGSTGTLALRAVFKNEDKTMFSGLFVRVRIPLGDPQPGLVIPNSAIGNDQQGDYVLVVDANDVVARRAITKGPLTPEGCVVRQGLTTTDRVIVNGLLNARPGEKVAPMEATGGDSTVTR